MLPLATRACTCIALSMRTASRPGVTFYWRIPCSFIRRPFLYDVASLARARLVASSCPPLTRSIAPCSTIKRLSFKPKATIANSLGWYVALPQGAGRQLVTWLLGLRCKPQRTSWRRMSLEMCRRCRPSNRRRNWLSQNQDPANQGADEGLLAWRHAVAPAGLISPGQCHGRSRAASSPPFR